MATTKQFVSQIYLKVGGKSASEEVMDCVISVTVESNLLMPDVFSIRLHDPTCKWIDSDLFDPGKTVEIEAGAPSETGQKRAKIMTGEITALEPVFGEGNEATLTIRGYSKGHRLNRGKKTDYYAKQKDCDIAVKIAQRNGMKAVTDQTSGVYEAVFQDNQTDMEFLQERARLNGYYLFVESDTMNFIKEPGSSSKAVLEWGANLISFESRLSTAGQVNKVTVRAWDPEKKQEIVGTSSSPASSPKIGEKAGGKAAKSAFQVESEQVINNLPVPDQQRAQNLAQAMMDELNDSYIRAEGSCLGNPDIKAGSLVEIKGLGKRFSGSYRISKCIHYYDKNGYFTSFEVSGHNNTSMAALLSSKENKGRGILVGIVTNTNDPKKLGRVQVKYPSLGENCISDWAKLVSPMAGKERGIAFFPEVDDEVLVAFESEDIHRPYILGSLWNSQDKPPQDVYAGGKVSQRIIRSVSGHVIVLDDSAGKEKISIVDKSTSNSVIIDTAKNSIIVQANKGPKVVINDPSGTVAVDDARGNTVTLSSSGVEVKGASKISQKAPQISIEADATLTMKGGANASLEGAMTSVKGSGILKLEGGLVNIN